MVSRLRVLLLFGVLALCGCKQDIYSSITEVDANQMLAVLMANGISAEKNSKGAKEGFSISVSSNDMLRAIALLNDAGLPKNLHVPMSKIFEKSGIMSSAFEEHVRYMYGLSEEVANTLSQIDGVVTARVHIVLPEAPQLGQPIKPSSAAVMIKHQPGVDLDFFVPQIRKLVSSAIEGLEYSAVTVVLTESAPTKLTAMPEQARDTVEVLPGLTITKASKERFLQLSIGVCAVLSLLSGYLVFPLLGRRRNAVKNVLTKAAVDMGVEP